MIIQTRESKLTDEVENFRAERVALLSDNQQSIPLHNGAKLVLHVIPTSAFNGGDSQLTIFDVNKDDLNPMAVGGWNHKVNFDGIAAVTSMREESDSYVQLFHNGTIEAVNVSYFHQLDSQMYIPITGWEKQLIERVTNYIKIQHELRVGLPVFVILSLLGVRGYQLMIDNSYSRSEGYKIDRDNLLVPALELKSLDCQIAEVLWPIFNRIWNAAGLRGSFHYDSAGKRKLR
jgi:hypothetical protein